MSRSLPLAFCAASFLLLSTASAEPFARRATFDPAAGPNEYTILFPSEISAAEVVMPINGGSFLLETDAATGTCRLVEWTQDVGAIDLFGASTGPITISLDATGDSEGTYVPETGEFSVTAPFLIEFDDSQLQAVGFASPLVLEGTESGRIDGVGRIGSVSMSLEGSGLFSGGTFTYTCKTTATIDYDLSEDETQAADVNRDKQIDLSDAVGMLEGLFLGSEPACPAAIEVNGDAAQDVSDPIYLMSYLFLDGPRPIEAIVDCPSV